MLSPTEWDAVVIGGVVVVGAALLPPPQAPSVSDRVNKTGNPAADIENEKLEFGIVQVS